MLPPRYHVMFVHRLKFFRRTPSFAHNTHLLANKHLLPAHTTVWYYTHSHAPVYIQGAQYNSPQIIFNPNAHSVRRF